MSQNDNSNLEKQACEINFDAKHKTIFIYFVEAIHDNERRRCC